MRDKKQNLFILWINHGNHRVYHNYSQQVNLETINNLKIHWKDFTVVRTYQIK